HINLSHLQEESCYGLLWEEEYSSSAHPKHYVHQTHHPSPENQTQHSSKICMPIPNALLTDEIKGTPYYNEYQEHVAKYQQHLDVEHGNAVEREAIESCKATKVEEPAYNEKEANLSWALKLSLKEQAEQTQGPAYPVVIRKPDSGRSQSLLEVQGKGKEKRRTPMPAEASRPAESPSLDVELPSPYSATEFGDEVPKINTGDQDEGQARPNLAVHEIVTDAVDYAMQAPLRARFSDLSAVYMKEILQHWMFEDKSYEAHEDHKKLYDALDKSLEHDYSDQLLSDLEEARASGALGHVTIQSQFFFNKDLEYLRHGSNGSSHALSISIMKAARYPDFGLELLVPKQMWIENDFKNLHPSNFEDLNLLLLQGYLDHLHMLSTDVKLWTRNLVIRQWVEDFQLGIESYQTQLKLTKLGWDVAGYKFKHDYAIIESPRAVVFSVNNNERKIMRFNEIYKFSDGTLTRILEALAYIVKEFKIKRINPGMNTHFWTQKDVTRSKEFIAAIEKRLNMKRIFRNLECFVGGRVRDIDYRLL
nr:hypothetical protein [Tanacetum cinerariifolium]